MRKLTWLVLSLLPLLAMAQEQTTVTRSAGKLVNDDSMVLSQKLQQSPYISQTTDDSQRRQLRTANHDPGVNFWIFDAWVELSGDNDLDGYYHRLTTSFDADVDTDLETVYAKLYVSRQGGAWVQVADTELFEIRYDSMADSYEVETELVEGFASGQYEVLIELHSLYHSGVVASMVLYQDADGYALTLEDQQRDQPLTPTSVTLSTSYGTTSGNTQNGYLVTEETWVAGSYSWQGMLLLALLLLVKQRYFRFRRA